MIDDATYDAASSRARSFGAEDGRLDALHARAQGYVPAPLDLSGQWADGLTVADVLARIDAPDGLEPEEADDLVTTYQESYDGALGLTEEEIEEMD